MLGFHTYAENPFSQYIVAINVLAFSGNVSAVAVAEPFYDVDAKAVLYLPSSYASTIVQALADVDAKANTTLVKVTINSYVNDFTDVDAKANITPTPAVATSVVENFYDVDAKANRLIPSVSAASQVAALADVDAQANLQLSSVRLNHYVNGTLVFDGKANVVLVSNYLTAYNEDIEATGVLFPYQDYADQYDRKQTLYVLQHPTTNTAYVSYENKTQYITADKLSLGDTVHILPEDNTVYIKELPESTTVFIAA